MRSPAIRLGICLLAMLPGFTMFCVSGAQAQPTSSSSPAIPTASTTSTKTGTRRSKSPVPSASRARPGPGAACVSGATARAASRRNPEGDHGRRSLLERADTVNFNADYVDVTYLHAVLSSRIFREAGVPCFTASHARLILNGSYLGFTSTRRTWTRISSKPAAWTPAATSTRPPPTALA